MPPVPHRSATPLNLSGHTIIIERLDTATARDIGQPDAAGQLAIIECHDDRRGKVCATRRSIADHLDLEDVARGIAHTYGARYAGIVQLAPGVSVRHGNPKLADWRGTVATDPYGRWHDSDGHIYVDWHAGTTGRHDGLPPGKGWYVDDALIPDGRA